MKCPVCDQENSTMLCARCGFDASRDYERYSTLGTLGRVPSVSARRREWYEHDQEKLEQISTLLAVLLALRHRQLTAEDPSVRAEQLRAKDLSNMLRQAQGENLWLRKQIQELEKKLKEVRLAKQESGNKLKKANNRIQKLEKDNKELNRANTALMQKNASLETDLETERNRGFIGRIFNR